MREPHCPGASMVPAGLVTYVARKPIDTSPSVKSNPSESEIRDWCVAYLAKSLKLAPERIDPQAKFARLGMDSAASVFLVAELEDWLGLDLSVELLFEHQTPAALARYLAARCAAQNTAIG
jgi:acyl carrier protein